MSTSKCCGTCRFYEENNGDCSAPVPEAVFEHDKDFMFASEGTNCEAWQEKRKDDEK